MSDNKPFVAKSLPQGSVASQGTTSTGAKVLAEDPQPQDQPGGLASSDLSEQGARNCESSPEAEGANANSQQGDNVGAGGIPPRDEDFHGDGRPPIQPPCGPLKVQVDAIFRSVGPELAQQVQSTDQALRSQLEALHKLVEATLVLTARSPTHRDDSECYLQQRLLLDPVLKDLRDANAELTEQLSSLDKTSAQILAAIVDLADRSEERTDDAKLALRDTGRALVDAQSLLQRLEHHANELRGEVEGVHRRVDELGKEENLRQKEQRDLAGSTRSRVDELGSLVKEGLLREVEAVGKQLQELSSRTNGLSDEIKSKLGEMESRIRAELSSAHKESTHERSQLRSTILQSHRKLAETQESLRKSVGGDLHGQVSGIGTHLRSFDEKVARELGTLISEQKLAGGGLSDSLRRLELIRAQIAALPKDLGTADVLAEVRSVSAALRTGFDKDLPLALAARLERLESVHHDLEKALANKLSVVDDKLDTLAIPIASQAGNTQTALNELKKFGEPIQTLIKDMKAVYAILEIPGVGKSTVMAPKASHAIAMFVSNIAALSIVVFIFLLATKRDCIAWPYAGNQSAAQAAEWRESQNSIQKEIRANVANNGKAISDVSTVVTSSEQKLQHISKCIEGALKSPGCRCPRSIPVPLVGATPQPAASCPSCIPSQAATNATNCNCNCFGKQQTPPVETKDVSSSKTDTPTPKPETPPLSGPFASPQVQKKG